MSNPVRVEGDPVYPRHVVITPTRVDTRPNQVRLLGLTSIGIQTDIGGAIISFSDSRQVNNAPRFRALHFNTWMEADAAMDKIKAAVAQCPACPIYGKLGGGDAGSD